MKSATTRHLGMTRNGFTIVELLIVVVVVAILAAITIVAYSGVTSRAQATRINSDLALLQKAITAARIAESKSLTNITGHGYTSTSCRDAGSIPDGTNLATLAKTHGCWGTYNLTLERISVASGINVRGLVDPGGWPYHIDENEDENGGCGRDSIAVFARPLNSYAVGSSDGLPVTEPGSLREIPRAGFGVCTAG